MFRPSLIIWRIGASPPAVPGIFTIRLGRLMRSCRPRAAVSVPAESSARSGATSTLTNPSPPWLESYSGANTSHAASMSAMTRVQ